MTEQEIVSKGFLILSHANKDLKLYLAENLIYSVYLDPQHKCTFVLSSGGALCPVKEAPEVVLEKLDNARKAVMTDKATKQEYPGG